MDGVATVKSRPGPAQRADVIVDFTGAVALVLAIVAAGLA